jgi:hypothetical protein
MTPLGSPKKQKLQKYPIFSDETGFLLAMALLKKRIQFEKLKNKFNVNKK